MRRALILLALVAPLAAAEAPAERDRGGWTEVLLTWSRGSASIPWNGTVVEVPDSAHHATDNETYLYVTGTTHEPSGGLGCDAPRGNATEGRWVLVSPEPCAWVAFPAAACWGTAACDAIETAPPVVVTRSVKITTTFPAPCSAIRQLRCTPEAPLAASLVVLALAALAVPRSGR